MEFLNFYNHRAIETLQLKSIKKPSNARLRATSKLSTTYQGAPRRGKTRKSFRRLAKQILQKRISILLEEKGDRLRWLRCSHLWRIIYTSSVNYVDSFPSRGSLTLKGLSTYWEWVKLIPFFEKQAWCIKGEVLIGEFATLQKCKHRI